MNLPRSLIVLLCVAAAGCSGREEASVPTAVPAPAQAPALVRTAAPAPAAPSSDGPPRCDDARAQELVKEAFIRRVLVEGDKALIARHALEPAWAFTEEEIVQAMPRMVAMARLERVTERGYDAATQRRHCDGSLAVDGWTDLAPPARYQIVGLDEPARFGVESSVQLLPGPEGFNMLIGYRESFGKAIPR